MINDLRKTLESHFADRWGSTTPAAYENIKFDTPDPDPTASSEWVRFTVITGEGFPSGYGGGTVNVRDTGLVSLQIFTPIGTGTATARGLADDFLRYFEHQRIPARDGSQDIVMAAGATRTVGPDGPWHQINVTIPFRRDRDVYT